MSNCCNTFIYEVLLCQFVSSNYAYLFAIETVKYYYNDVNLAIANLLRVYDVLWMVSRQKWRAGQIEQGKKA